MIILIGKIINRKKLDTYIRNNKQEILDKIKILQTEVEQEDYEYKEKYTKVKGYGEDYVKKQHQEYLSNKLDEIKRLEKELGIKR